MLTAARFLCLSLFALLTPTACSQGGGAAGESPSRPETSPTDPTAATNDAPSSARGILIGQVVTHDAKVSIVGGGRDLRVVIRKIDGTMVADGLTLAELRTRDADLYEVVTSARASADGTGGRRNYVDATLDMGHLH